MDTTVDQATDYHDSPMHLRADLLAQHKAFSNRAGSGVSLDLHALTASNYAYTLAALLGWIGREHGTDAEHRAACMVDDLLTNGDSNDLNADVRVSS